MPNVITTVVDETVGTLNQKILIELKPPTQEALIAIINPCFDAAFAGVETKKDRRTLYRKLALKLHPDQLQNQNNAMFLYLEEIQASGIFIQLLSKYIKEENLFKLFFQNPNTAIVELEKKLDHKFQTDIKQYPDQGRNIAKLIYEKIDSSLSIIILVYGIAVSVPLKLYNALEDMLVKKIYDNNYDNKERNFFKLLFLAKTLYQTISSHLPEKKPFYTLFIIKPLQLLFGTLLLLASSLKELVNHMIMVFSFIIITALLSIKATGFLILTLPLILESGIEWLTNSLHANKRPPDSELPPGSSPANNPEVENNSTQRMKALLGDGEAPMDNLALPKEDPSLKHTILFQPAPALNPSEEPVALPTCDMLD